MPPDPCPLCNGTGWRHFTRNGYECSEPCDHKQPERAPDAKARAAGEERSDG